MDGGGCGFIYSADLDFIYNCHEPATENERWKWKQQNSFQPCHVHVCACLIYTKIPSQSEEESLSKTRSKK